MMKLQTRRMVAAFVLADVVATPCAWLLAYYLRFHSGLLEAVPRASRTSPATCCCSR